MSIGFPVAMAIGSGIVLAACLLVATPARADDTPKPLPPLVGEVLQKGLVGKALDAVPMDPEERVALQRTSTVVSSTLSGRSLTAWAGLTHPLLVIAGLAWGIYSAFNINAPPASARPSAKPGAKPNTTPLRAPVPAGPIVLAAVSAPSGE